MDQQRRVHVLARHLTAADDLDPAAIRAKYREERDKRLAAQEGRTGQSQYILDLAKSAKVGQLENSSATLLGRFP